MAVGEHPAEECVREMQRILVGDANWSMDTLDELLQCMERWGYPFKGADEEGGGDGFEGTD